jgi:outer membrane usher protein
LERAIMRFAKGRILPAVSSALTLGAGLLLHAGDAGAEKSDVLPGYVPAFAAPPGAGMKPAPPAEPVRDAKGDKPPAPAPADDGGLGDIQWSHGPGKTAPRAMEMEVPLQEDKFRLGDVKVKISAQGEVSIARERLLQILLPIMRPEAGKMLAEAAGQQDYVALTALTDKGFALRWDANLVTLYIDLTIEQRTKRSLSASTRREMVMSENLSQPAMFAAYVNVHAGADYVEQTAGRSDGGISNMRLDLQGAARWQNFVLEGEATVEQDGSISRRGTRIIYDIPPEALRIAAGDVAPLTTGFQGGTDVLGVAVEKSYQKLQPGANIRPTSGHSFRIERPSTVDIKINGFVTQRLHLRPGDYDLSDLPLSGGANDIELIIEDDTGQQRTLKFSVFSGMSLLAPGMSEWAVTAGVQSHVGQRAGSCAGGVCSSTSQLEYDFNEPVVTGFYQRGLTPAITASTNFQTDTRVFMGGAGAMFATSFGFFGLDGAASQSEWAGTGFALHSAYELANIQAGDGVHRSVRLAGEYRSSNFAVVDVLAPVNNTMLNLSASYSQDLPWQLSGSLSANYAVGREGYGDGYGVDLSLGRSFGSSISAGMTVGYEQSASGIGSTDTALQRDGFRAAMRLNYRLDEKSSFDSTHDMRDGRSQIAYRRQDGSGVGSWSTQVELDRQAPKGSEETYNANGSVSYVGNRADVSVSHYTSTAGLNTSNMEQRSSVTMGTAFAFADGLFAVGRPVSNGFAIVAPHANLSGSDVSIGSSQDSRRAGSDMLGPALVNDVSPYSQSRLPVDVNNLPAGYDLGAGGFDLYAPYKSGYRLTVGSDYTVTVLGSLLGTNGEPISLLTGDAWEEGHKDGRHVQVFTGPTGKFGAQGMRPGRWVIEMATEPVTHFIVDVPKNTVGLLRAGTLKPAKGTS